jgi:hypothetical protein
LKEILADGSFHAKRKKRHDEGNGFKDVADSPAGKEDLAPPRFAILGDSPEVAAPARG